MTSSGRLDFCKLLFSHLGHVWYRALRFYTKFFITWKIWEWFSQLSFSGSIFKLGDFLTMWWLFNDWLWLFSDFSRNL